MSEIITDLNVDYHLIIDKPYPIYLGALPWNSYSSVPADTIFNFCGDIPESGTMKKTFIFPFLDDDREDSVPDQKDIFDFLHVANVYATQGPTFWHCHAGVNRSAFMLASYLWLYHDDFKDTDMNNVIGMIRNKRYDYCLCNDAFVKRLLEM